MARSGSTPSRARVWDTATWKEVVTLKGLRGNVLCVAFSSDGKTLAIAGPSEPGRLYDTATWTVRQKLRGGSRGPHWLAFSPDGKVIATVGFTVAPDYDPITRMLTPVVKRNSTVWLYDAATGRKLRSILWPEPNLLRLAFTPDGETLAGDGAGMAVLFDLKADKAQARLQGQEGEVMAFALSPSGKTLATAVRLEDTRGKSLGRGRRAPTKGRLSVVGALSQAYGAAFSPDGKTLAVVGSSSNVYLYDVASGKEWARLPGFRTTYESVAFSPDGRTLVTGGGDGYTRVWDVPKREGDPPPR